MKKRPPERGKKGVPPSVPKAQPVSAPIVKKRRIFGHSLLLAAALIGGDTEKSGSQKITYDEGIEAGPERKEFKVGNFTFTFENFSAADMHHIRELIQKTYASMNRYMPLDATLPRKIPVIKNPSYGPLSQYDINTNTLTIGSMINDGLTVHELVHAYHGLDSLDYVSQIEEGIATAIAMLVAEEHKLEYMNNKGLVMGRTLQNGGLGLNITANFTGFGPLLDPRYIVAGEFWRDLEKEKPGFLRQFHEGYYRFFKEENGLKDPQLPTTLIQRFIAPHFPDFLQRTMRSPISIYNPRLIDRPMLYSYYTHNSDPTKGNLRVAVLGLAQKRSEHDGLEEPLMGREVEYQIINESTHELGPPTKARTDGRGMVRLYFQDDTHYFQLVKKPLISPGDEVTINVRSTELNIGDTVTFSL